MKAHETGAKRVVFASRSSEWEDARSLRIRDCFEYDPTIIRLQPLQELEQKALFSSRFPDESFELFRKEIERFDLEPLLGNPQFLELFAEAFVESGRAFTNKQKIFVDAVRRLARFSGVGIAQKTEPSADKRITWTNEVFAKLQLSGAVGVGVADTVDERQFPRLTFLVKDGSNVNSILDTRLFKLTDNPNQHEPIHRIVAEFCAAQYLAKRIDDSAVIYSTKLNAYIIDIV